MMNKSRAIILAVGLISTIFSVSAYSAGNGHDHGHASNEMSDTSHSKHSMSHEDNSGMLLKKKHIDGYMVSFHVMEANDSMRHGGSHNFMIKVEKDGKTESSVVINSKVVHPDGKSESKMLMKMGDWHMSGYDLAQKGKYQMMILFKTADGKKHNGGVYYTK